MVTVLNGFADAGVVGKMASRTYEVKGMGAGLIFWPRKSPGDRLLKHLCRLKFVCFLLHVWGETTPSDAFYSQVEEEVVVKNGF